MNINCLRLSRLLFFIGETDLELMSQTSNFRFIPFTSAFSLNIICQSRLLVITFLYYVVKLFCHLQVTVFQMKSPNLSSDPENKCFCSFMTTLFKHILFFC